MMNKPITRILALLGSLLLFNVSAQTTDKLTDITALLSLKNATIVNDHLLTGGQPNIEDLKLLSAQGYNRIVNLRGDKEFSEFDEALIANNLGFNYTHIPVNGADGLTFDNLVLFNRALVGQQQNNVTDKTLVHCASGNRVGAFFALNAYFVDGKSLEQSITIGKAAGLGSLEPNVIEFIKNNAKMRQVDLPQ